MNNNQKPQRVATIVTHAMPHVDEVLAIVLLQFYREEYFPGISKATIEFWDAGRKTPDGKHWKEWLKKGYLPVGVAGSMFDEHPTDGQPRKEGHCAASLVARYLEIEENPEIEQLLRYVVNNDTNGGTNPFDLAALITLANKTYFSTDAKATFEWATQPIIWYLKKQQKFFKETRDEFDKYANIFETYHKGRSFTAVAIESDNTDIAAYARSKYGASAALVIQRNSKGQVSITTQKQARMQLDEVIRLIRIEELKLDSIGTRFNNTQLTIEGNMVQGDKWYYDKPAMRIFNGSLSAPNVPSTKIQFKHLVELVKKGLNRNFIMQSKKTA